MLEKIREGSQGVWAMVILGLVILSFVFAGVGSYVTAPTDTAAAVVNGEEISQSALERAYQNERARLESQFGDAFNALAADTEYLKNFRQSVLDRLIGDKLIEQTARDLGLRVSDTQIRDTIVAMPEFQIAGQFNNDRFQVLLRQAGYQPNTFRDYMRVEMTRQQVSRAILGSEFSLPGETKLVHELQRQTRDIRYATITAQQFAADITLSEDEISTFYQANLDTFDTQEQVSVSYVELKATDLLSEMTVTEQDLLDFYEQSSGAYRTEEERRASHILIEFGEDRDAAKVEAEALLAKVQADENFAELAKTSSADSFSAENGGDLDWFARGVMDPAFEEATFALANIGDTTTVVESEFGFHIIKLTDIKSEQVTPFEEVRADIENSVKNEKASERFFEIQQRMSEIAFEVPDSLEDMVSELSLTLKSTELFDRNGAPQPIANPVVLNTVFSPELIEDAVNSDVLEVADEHIIVARVQEHKAARTKSIDEVKEDIETRLMAQKAQQAAKNWSENVLTSLASGTDVSAELESKNSLWEEQAEVARFGSALDSNIATEAFKLSLAEGKNAAVVELNNGDVSLLELTKIHQAVEADSQELISLGQSLESSRSQNMFAALVESLKAQADITTYNL